MVGSAAEGGAYATRRSGEDPLLDIALYKLSLGRASLQQCLTEAKQNRETAGRISVPSTVKVLGYLSPDTLILKVDGASLSTLRGNKAFKETLQIAKNWLDQAVDGLREAGTEDYLPHSLIARASYHRYALAFAIQADPTTTKTNTPTSTTLPLAHQSALQDLQEAHDIAQRGGMRLHLTDYHLESARLALTLDQTVHEQTAKQHLTQARDLITATGYKRRLPELEYLEQL